MVRPLHIRGAHIWDGSKTVQRDLYTNGDRISAVPVADAQVIDLDGYTIFPGLINAHDHLELNHYPRSKFRERYDNAHQWGEDMNARLNDEPYKSLRAYPLWDKLFIGGLKNLLCGATTVAHHNPPHKELWRKDFPVRVLKQYGWSHSLHFSTDEEVVRSYRSTPKDWPWFIHLAEGTDDVAAGEYQRLKALGCIGVNTVIIHGVGLDSVDVVKAQVDAVGTYNTGHGSQIPVVWCPTTNIFLLDKTGHARMGWNTGIFLGSDSRLTADGDLLDELKFASEYYGKGQLTFTGYEIALSMVTTPNLRWHHVLKNAVAPLRAVEYADFVIINDIENPSKKLCNSRRADLALVVKGGVPQIGDPELMARFTGTRTVDATLDGKPKAIHIELAKRIHANSLKEAGLEVDVVPKRKLFQFI
ncbi:MAG: hypothetical protein LCI00_05945 [Chloroflexi bacterium]|nr:hypothetical protein [Chloroflexota bacterium]MCC6891867.1 hypothetical protein [Anaerolineae bacterium]